MKGRGTPENPANRYERIFLEPEMTCRAIISIAPEFDRPRLTMSTSAMITVAGCPKPENA